MNSALVFRRLPRPRPSKAEHNSVTNHLYSFAVPKARQPDDSANFYEHKLGLLRGRFSLFPETESQGL